MASLAPGNGWFPRRQPYGMRGSPNSRNDKVERRQTLRTSRNAVEVRRSGNAGILLAAAGSRHVQETTVKPVDLPASESVMTGKAATSMTAWDVLAAVLALLMWVGGMAAYAGGTLALGVPWTTLAVAMSAVQLLAAGLVVLLSFRVGRDPLPASERRSHAAD